MRVRPRANVAYLATATPEKQQRHPVGVALLGEKIARQGSRREPYSLYSTLLTETHFLPPFSETVPVTVPALASMQVSL
jgi:hypothetical protein